MKYRSFTVKRVCLSRITQICMIVFFMAWTESTKADLIAYTSFEEALVPASAKYSDTDSTSTHALINNAGQPLVNWNKTGAELGFSSSYSRTRGSRGRIADDSVGVMKEMASKGLQSFTMSDIDGLMTTTLDSVLFSDYLNVTLSLDLYIAATSWEATDHVRIWTGVDGGAELDLFNASGPIIESGELGGWQQLSLDLSGYTFGTLAFSLASNANPEKIYIDNVQFRGEQAQGEQVPVPDAFLLGCLGLGFYPIVKRRLNY
jgi:hypothetical protein